MPRPDSIAGFFLRFLILYALLIIPWPGWNAAYGAYFRTLGETIFNHGERRVVQFEPFVLQHGFSTLGTRMVVSNRALVDSEGNGPVRSIELDTRGIGWIPTALTLALILASPVPWKHRGWALLWGLLLIQVFILFSLQTILWMVGPDLSLLTLNPIETRIVDELEYALITQMGASFSIPVVIWILVTFRRQDYVGLGKSIDIGRR